MDDHIEHTMITAIHKYPVSCVKSDCRYKIKCLKDIIIIWREISTEIRVGGGTFRNKFDRNSFVNSGVVYAYKFFLFIFGLEGSAQKTWGHISGKFNFSTTMNLVGAELKVKPDPRAYSPLTFTFQRQYYYLSNFASLPQNNQSVLSFTIRLSQSLGHKASMGSIGRSMCESLYSRYNVEGP